MRTNIISQAKRLVALLKEFDELDDEGQNKAAFLIGARLLSIESELRTIGRYIDPSCEPLSLWGEAELEAEEAHEASRRKGG